MFNLATFTSLALSILTACVHASVYVTNPTQGSPCAGGQACQLQWTDDGQPPLLSQIGECSICLYTADGHYVQSFPSVDVSTTSSLTFTPDPAAGADGQYYILFSSTSIGVSYNAESAHFSLSDMTGTNAINGSSTPPGSPASTSASSSTSPISGSGTSTSGTDTTTPSVTGTGTTPTTSATTPTTSHTSSTTSSTTTTASATPSNAAARVGSSTSFGGVAAVLILSGVLVL